MARTYRNTAGAKHKSSGGAVTAERRSQISHALSKLLRHQAESEKVPITSAGWVRMDDLLAWRGMNRISKDLTISEIFEVVEEDGRSGKGRFGLKVAENDAIEKDEPNVPQLGYGSDSVDVDDAAVGDMVEATASSSLDDSRSTPAPIDLSSKNSPETQLAIQHHTDNPSTPASRYSIRATQGHTIRSVGSADLLTAITLSEPSTIPSTVVHGTFYGAWPLILSSGGLKSMGRNNVHFATGPSLEEVLSTIPSETSVTKPEGLRNKDQVGSLLSRDKVISGMRWDAQILIYVDLKRCLEDIARRNLDMTWWKSENGVILTEGVDDKTPNPMQATSESVAQGPSSLEGLGEGSIKSEGEVLIASKHAKAQKHRENIEEQNTVSPLSRDSEANEGEGTVLIASQQAKMQKHRENIEQQQPTSSGTDTSQTHVPRQDELEVIIAQKHAKMQKHRENMEQNEAGGRDEDEDEDDHESEVGVPTRSNQARILGYLNQVERIVQSKPHLQSSTTTPSNQTTLPEHHQSTHQPTTQLPKIVPMRYISHVVEIKAGLGVLWQHDRGGVVQDLPDNLKNTPLPRGKDRGSGARGGNRGRAGGGGRGRGSGKSRE